MTVSSCFLNSVFHITQPALLPVLGQNFPAALSRGVWTWLLSGGSSVQPQPASILLAQTHTHTHTRTWNQTLPI